MEVPEPAGSAEEKPRAQEPDEGAQGGAEDSDDSAAESAEAEPIRVWRDGSVVRWRLGGEAAEIEESPDDYILIFSLDEGGEEIIAFTSVSGSEIELEEIIRLLDRQRVGDSCYLTVIASFAERDEIRSEPFWLEIEGTN